MHYVAWSTVRRCPLSQTVRTVLSPSTRTATIFAADAANYSRAMSLDEQRALAALEESRKVIDAVIAAHAGRIFSTGGDSVLAEFSEIGRAVSCAVKIQQSLADAGARGMETLPYRIGIHVGHVYPNGEDLLGETVNITARLESLAYPGGVCLSETALASFEPPPHLRIEGIGAQTLKGIKKPIRVARIRLGEPDRKRKSTRDSRSLFCRSVRLARLGIGGKV